MNGTASKFYKQDPMYVYKWVATFINGLQTHSHAASSLPDVLTKPVIKNGLKSPIDSASSWSNALSSSASNLIE